MFRFAPLSLALFSTSLLAHQEFTDFATVWNFRASEVVHFENDRLQSDSSLSLDGEYKEVILDKPRVVYYLRVIPAYNHFYVKIGCRVITREMHFRPSVLIGRYPADRQNYFVSAVHFGGSKSQAFSYLQIKASTVAAADYQEFGENELLEFEAALESLLNQFENRFHLESFAMQPEETVGVGDMVTFVEPYTAAAPQPGVLRQLLDRLIKKPAPETLLRTNPRLATGSVLALRRYVDLLLKSGKSQPEVLVVDRLQI